MTRKTELALAHQYLLRRGWTSQAAMVYGEAPENREFVHFAAAHELADRLIRKEAENGSTHAVTMAHD